ncbi:MAG: dTDP-4-dehydrorhamnose 3,5-epimerase [Candidatus Omnitrophota bacterium]
MAFKFIKTKIPEVVLIQPQVYKDNRGSFLETFKQSEFKFHGLNLNFVQTNHSYSAKNVLRGLHYQTDPKAQGKLISVVQGEIFDVAVDIRRQSATYGQWVAEILSQANGNMLYLPQGFAHGFCVLSGSAYVIYQCTNEYSPENDAGILWCDPTIDISWPVKKPILSAKDANLPLFGEV